jgi:hypothetical protein
MVALSRFAVIFARHRDWVQGFFGSEPLATDRIGLAARTAIPAERF